MAKLKRHNLIYLLICACFACQSYVQASEAMPDLSKSELMSELKQRRLSEVFEEDVVAFEDTNSVVSATPSQALEVQEDDGNLLTEAVAIGFGKAKKVARVAQNTANTSLFIGGTMLLASPFIIYLLYRSSQTHAEQAIDKAVSTGALEKKIQAREDAKKVAKLARMSDQKNKAGQSTNWLARMLMYLIFLATLVAVTRKIFKK